MQLGENLIVGGRDQQGDKGEPARDQALEQDLVLVTQFLLITRLDEDVSAVLLGEECAEGDFEETVDDLFPGVTLGLIGLAAGPRDR